MQPTINIFYCVRLPINATNQSLKPHFGVYKAVKISHAAHNGILKSGFNINTPLNNYEISIQHTEVPYKSQTLHRSYVTGIQ